jgi:hypothetical protein
MKKIGCGQEIETYTPGGRQIWHKCGEFYGGRTDLCDDCNELAEALYPQGWTGYPGDICPHGVYTGGCGADYMCGACEAGYDDAEEPTECYVLMSSRVPVTGLAMAVYLRKNYANAERVLRVQEERRKKAANSLYQETNFYLATVTFQA